MKIAPTILTALFFIGTPLGATEITFEDNEFTREGPLNFTFKDGAEYSTTLNAFLRGENPGDGFQDALEKAKSDLLSTYADGGIGLLIAEMALETLENKKYVYDNVELFGNNFNINEVGWKLKKSKMYIHYNMDNRAAYLDISTEKKNVAICGGSPNWKYRSRRWVISVDRGHLDEKHLDGSKYLLYATGTAIHMLSYYESEEWCEGESKKPLKLIKKLRPDNSRDPRYKYYAISGESCIDIFFKEKPKNDKHIYSDPSSLKFCASGCATPGVDATNGA